MQTLFTPTSLPALPYSYYRFVPGQERFPRDLYGRIAEQCDASSVLVEVGVGFGRSTCMMAELLEYYGKRPKFYVLDRFGTLPETNDGGPLAGLTPWGEDWSKWASRVGGSSRLLDQFLFYLNNCPSKDRLTDWAQFSPWHCAEEFKDGTVSFAFLNDAAGGPDQVQKQIDCWLPKIRPGGTLGVYGGAVKRGLIQDGANADDGYTLVIEKPAV